MIWTRKTKEFEYAPYVSEDGKYSVLDINVHPVGEWEELLRRNWESKESHEKLMRFAKENKIRISGASWAVINNITNEITYGFKTAKEAKNYAEQCG